MTGTTVSSRLTGSAWLAHMNKTVAETMYANIEAVGLPTWDDADQTLAKGLQKELKQPEIGLPTKLQPLRGDIPPEQNYGGGSDDIGDISWNVPTATLNYPANIPNLPGHHWANAVAMATPIAHKGTTAGAKVQARTILDFLLRPGAGRRRRGPTSATCRRRTGSTSRSSRRTTRRPSTSTRSCSTSSGPRCGSSTTTRRSTRPTSTSSA